jgi:ribosomal 30S subunit maturation factor RimM
VAICQQKIWIERELLALRPNEYLWQDLVGLPVWDFCGKQLGVIQKVYNFGASDCIEILGSTGTLDLPLVPVYFDLARMDEGIRCLLPLEALDDLWSRNASRSISHHTLSSKS